MKCAKCNSEMEEGFRIDFAGASGMYRERWIQLDLSEMREDKVRKIFWNPENALQVKTYRCTSCGYLESYA